MGHWLETIRLVADALQPVLTTKEALLISRIVALDPKDKFPRAVRQAVSVRHGERRVSGEFADTTIRQGYVISCGRTKASEKK